MILALALLFAPGLCMSQEKPAPIVLTFRTARSLMLVAITVDGKPKTLIFDTGAERTIIHSTGGDVEHRAILIVGSKVLSNFPLIMANLSGMDMGKVGADGVLGQDVLRQFSHVRIDYKAGTIELTP